MALPPLPPSSAPRHWRRPPLPARARRGEEPLKRGGTTLPAVLNAAATTMTSSPR